MKQLDEEVAGLLRVHQDAVQRLAAVPGLGADSAQQIIAEVGPTATTFPTAKRLVSWVGACPGHEESACIDHSHRSPNGNRQMRRLLNQAAHAAVKTKGSIFELLYRRFVVRLGTIRTINGVFARVIDGMTLMRRRPPTSTAVDGDQFRRAGPAGRARGDSTWCRGAARAGHSRTTAPSATQ
jgi:hypothetical protein